MKKLFIILIGVFAFAFTLFYLKSRSYLSQNSGLGTGDISDYTASSAWEPALINSGFLVVVLIIVAWMVFKFERYR
jgi:hypothetical protein